MGLCQRNDIVNCCSSWAISIKQHCEDSDVGVLEDIIYVTILCALNVEDYDDDYTTQI